MDPQVSVGWIANSVGMLPPENLSREERDKFLTQITEAATAKNYRRIQSRINDFVAIYRRRVISPRSKSQGKGFFDGIAFRFQG